MLLPAPHQTTARAVPLLGSTPVTGLDDEADSLIGYRSPVHGRRPEVQGAADRGEELELLTERIRSWLASGIEPNAIGVAARSAYLVRQASEALAAAGMPTTKPGASGALDRVRAGTMHGMKGLEFQAVAVIGVEDGQVPSPAAVTPAAIDEVVHQQDLLRERCVLFVAADAEIGGILASQRCRQATDGFADRRRSPGNPARA